MPPLSFTPSFDLVLKIPALWRLGCNLGWDNYKLNRWDQANQLIRDEAGSIGAGPGIFYNFLRRMVTYLNDCRCAVSN